MRGRVSWLAVLTGVWLLASCGGEGATGDADVSDGQAQTVAEVGPDAPADVPDGPGDVVTDAPGDPSAEAAFDAPLEASPEVTPDVAQGGFVIAPPVWGTCSKAALPGATCANVEVPLDWSDPTGRTIHLTVWHMDAYKPPSTGQLWALQGGPGEASIGTVTIWSNYFRHTMAPTMDLYVVDHRGCGQSTPLDCQALQAGSSLTGVEAMQACVDELKQTWGDGLSQFSSTAAGRDLGELIHALLPDGQSANVWAVSYGARWVHRYLQQFPDQARAVALDSVLAEGVDFWHYDEGVDRAARRILKDCDADTFCAGKLGGDAVGATTTLLADWKAGHCATSGVTVDQFRDLLRTFAMNTLPIAALPAVVYRAIRCDATDAQVIASLAAGGGSGVADTRFTPALNLLITINELFAYPWPTAEEQQAMYDGLLVGFHDAAAVQAYAVWPYYGPGPYWGTFADTKTPILFMNGSHDGLTPPDLAQAFASHFTAPGQQFVRMENGAHTLIVNSSDGRPPSYECGIDLPAAFLSNPTGTLDTSCKDLIAAFDFHNPVKDFGTGTNDAWENATTL